MALRTISGSSFFHRWVLLTCMPEVWDLILFLSNKSGGTRHRPCGHMSGLMAIEASHTIHCILVHISIKHAFSLCHLSNSDWWWKHLVALIVDWRVHQNSSPHSHIIWTLTVCSLKTLVYSLKTFLCLEIYRKFSRISLSTFLSPFLLLPWNLKL